MYPSSKPPNHHSIANAGGFIFKMKRSLFKTFIRKLLNPNIHNPAFQGLGTTAIYLRY